MLMYPVTIHHTSLQSKFDVVHIDSFDWLQAHDVTEDKRVEGLWVFFLDLVGCVL